MSGAAQTHRLAGVSDGDLKAWADLPQRDYPHAKMDNDGGCWIVAGQLPASFALMTIAGARKLGARLLLAADDAERMADG